MFFSLFLSLSPFPSSRAKYGGTRVQPRVRKNDFENGGETARIHARESIVFLPGGARTIGTAARQTREGRGWFARPLRAAGKIGARTSARHISWFPVHLPSQSANAGRRGGQWETRNDRKRCRSLSTLYPAAQVTRAAEHGFYRILSIHEILAD